MGGQLDPQEVSKVLSSVSPAKSSHQEAPPESNHARNSHFPVKANTGSEEQYTKKQTSPKVEFQQGNGPDPFVVLGTRA
jgi:hypothetical protein